MLRSSAGLAFLLLLSSPLSPDASLPSPWAWEDREAASLVRELERSSAEASGEVLSRIRERRLPQTVPALVALLDRSTLTTWHDDFCTDNHFLSNFQLGKSFALDSFEQAFCVALSKPLWFDSSLKRRGCVRTYDQTAESLREASRGRYPWLQILALLALQEAGDSQSVPDLHRWSRPEALARYPWAGPVVDRLRKDFSCEAVCRKAVAGGPAALKAVLVTRDRPAIEKLLASMGAVPADADRVWTLGEFGDRRAIPRLLQELRAGSYWSKADAAEALGKIGDPSVLPDLVAAVGGETAWVQVHLFGAIGRFGSEDEIPLLQKYAESREYTGAVGRARCAERALDELRKRLGR